MNETNSLLNLKSNQNTTYIKTEIDNLHNTEFYTREETLDNFHTKVTVSELMDEKQNTLIDNTYNNFSLLSDNNKLNGLYGGRDIVLTRIIDLEHPENTNDIKIQFNRYYVQTQIDELREEIQVLRNQINSM